MELFDLLNSVAIQRAYNRTFWSGFRDNRNNKDNSFAKYLEYSFDEYAKALKNLKKGNKFRLPDNIDMNIIVKLLGIFKDGILETVCSYHEGHPSESFQRFNSMMEQVQNEDPEKNVEQGFFFDNRILKEVPKGTKDLHLFRMRECIDPLEMDSRKSIFHVPFDKRNFITVARYSIPGFPSLYLGRSLYACWKEMKRTSFDNLYFSRFNFSESTKVFFLAHDPNDMLSKEQYVAHHMNMKYKKDLYSFLALWPLQLACSIPTIDSNASFYPEYIIPQMLMQWVRKSNLEIDGICYRTTRIPLTHKIRIRRKDDFDKTYPSLFPKILNNYVFPVKNSATKGHCKKLAKKFLCTSPILWNVADIDDSKSRRPREDETRLPSHETWIDNITIPLNDIEIYYGDSVWGRCEKTSLLKSFQSGKIGP